MPGGVLTFTGAFIKASEIAAIVDIGAAGSLVILKGGYKFETTTQPLEIVRTLAESDHEWAAVLTRAARS